MARNIHPAQKRAQLVRAKRLGLGSALAEMQMNFLTRESRDVFGDWRRHPITLMMIEALREIALTLPMDIDSIHVQYGYTSGVSWAAAFLDDPSTLYSHLFTGVAPGTRPLPETDYSSDPLSDSSSGEG